VVIYSECIILSKRVAYNVFGLGEGGGFYHLGSAEINAESASWRMINLRRGGLWSTEPPLLPIENQRS
jgi:hypothetical protein